MAISANNINTYCASLQQKIAKAYPELSIHFILHRRGKLRESVSLAEHDVMSHYAGDVARVILKKHHQNDRSSFLGLAIRQENKWFGFKKIDHLLGLININQDEFETEDQLKLSVAHQIWHAIDLYNIRQNPIYKNRFRSGPIIPKRSDMNLSRANLQADIFSAVLNTLYGESNDLDDLMKQRGLQSLSPINDIKAENYPSIIAMDACQFALEELKEINSSDHNKVEIAYDISTKIGQTFDSSNIQQWWDFSIPAQDMAWRGYAREDILSAAIYTSNSPFVRSIGYLIQEVTNVEPSLESAILGNYNAFMDPDVNMKLHRELVDTIFDEAMFQSEEEKSSRALLNAANKQNEELTEGRFLGWCASALQDAAQAFERALLNGSSPQQAARMQFEGTRDEPSWEDLKNLGNKIVDQRREGVAVTMGHIAEICCNNDMFAPVLESIQMTMNDPSYVQTLQAANDLALQPSVPTPSAPQPKMPSLQKSFGPKEPKIETPAAPMPMPGIGGTTNNTAHIIRQRQLVAQQQKESNNLDDHSGDKR